ncbi:hypothetical protein EGW08_001509 [Elysia chlorotica]|uniref:AAA+ ATPase domain-containing protein n=1 Tax=Elysia chlorotica TaxID=188477 RepID=A0A3S1CES7_ELYCH|nr:hypothetical protein EGW08_001509 [Elysia chlorotica]
MKETDETHLWRLHSAVKEVCKLTINSGLSTKLQKFLSKQIWTQSDRQSILTIFTEIFLDGSYAHELTVCLGPLILDVVSQLKHIILNDARNGSFKMKKFAIVLSDGFSVSPELRHFALDFVKVHSPLKSCEDSSLGEPKRKKTKRDQVPDLDWCRAVFNYMIYVPEAAERLDMCSLMSHLSHSDTLTRWYAASAISIYCGMSEQEASSFLKKYFTQEEQRSMCLRLNSYRLGALERARPLLGLVQVERGGKQSYTKHDIIGEDLHASVVNVMGVLLPSCHQPQTNDGEIKTKAASDELVMVPSTCQHLRSLALAVSCAKHVLLQGPVGCGKTCLVEHLAVRTGHKLVKIQLGDQTDSKALLGTYCSTEVPGEFVWRAGVLTRAVAAGQWVLLEDVDTAPMDVLSLLVGLVETGALTGAGGGTEAWVQAAPGFQLFTTQRFLSSSEGVHKERAGNSSVLEKHCSVIYVEPLSGAELAQVITTKFPALGPVTEKLLDIYFMLSAGRHDTGSDSSEKDASTHGKFFSSTGRLVSTRDLMTWCSRSSVNFDHTESSQGQKVFLEAVDCFVASLSKLTLRLRVAAAIGFKLNIPEDRSKYFLTEYKPNLRESTTCLEIGRATVQRTNQFSSSGSKQSAPTFSYTRSTLVLLEKVAICVQRNEPVLLSGETGTGKTFTVQYLAHYLGHKLHVINLNQQSDSSDLLGGFKPVDMKFLVMPLREEFEILFCETFSRTQNEKFLSHIQTLFSKKRWKDLLILIEAPVKNALKRFESETAEFGAWTKISRRIGELRQQIQDAENVLAFSFIEGTLVRALRSGDWVLLDEINLASADMLECLSGLLESSAGSVVLTERGDAQPIKRNPEFRLFACMNPATDVGKKDLPVGIRNRFTEFYVEEMECPRDLATLVRDYLPGLSLGARQISGMVNFYLTIKGDQADKLTDGTGHKPHFSLRTLCRALRYCAKNPCKSVPRSLYEGFCMSFLTAIDRSSHPIVEGLILKHVLATSSTKAVLGQKLPQPEQGHHVDVAGYWVAMGSQQPQVPEHYIVTPSVKRNLRDLARVVSAG